MPLAKFKRRTLGGFIWYVRGTVRVQGRRESCYESAGTDRQDLAEAYRIRREGEIYNRLLHGERASVSFAAAALSYLEHEARSAHTLDYVGRLQLHFGDAALRSIDQVSADHAARSIVAPDAGAATKRRVVYGPLAAILHHAARRGWCDAPRFDQPKPPKGKTRWLAPTEALALIAAAAPHLRPLLVFLLGTGARLSEALELGWADVHLSESRAIFRDTKSGVDRAAALPSAVVAALSALPHRTGLVFLRPKYVRTQEGISTVMVPYADREREEGGQIKTAFRAACRRAGIEALTPHDLRHTWATWLYVVTRDPMLLRDEGRWASLSMVERYAHLAPPEIAQDVHMVWGASHPRAGMLPRAQAVLKTGEAG